MRLKAAKGPSTKSAELASLILRMNNSNEELQREDDFPNLDLNGSTIDPSIEANETRTEVEVSEAHWVHTWIPIIQKYILPTLIFIGAVSNVVSIFVLKMKRLKMKRSLTNLFVYLNMSDL